MLQIHGVQGYDVGMSADINVTTDTYVPRVAERELQSCLEAAGAVLIEGPRACGKTELAKRVAASAVFLDVDHTMREAINIDPALVLTGETPRLIDEWQTAPAIWNHVRRAVDARDGRGHFILTGSAVPPDDTTRHTGAGRIIRLHLRPMSLFELGRSTGNISLRDTLNGVPARSLLAELSATALAELICIGGWPEYRRSPSNQARRANWRTEKVSSSGLHGR